ncbi:ABC transporter ATP-binding protein [Ferviditalea candida]|uniref:ABC transporter ATP-binding protein n=1 Tax=Ferviditalea candida TaxID=3108399 RepID=A0ABU5ZGA1_9BACL|nr:ABC transporter ATP-binding protein [Paenibacillaceae bacterium T2]
MGAEPILELKEYTLFFESNHVRYSILDAISLTVKRGELVGIVGESGCGKTMLGNSISGLLPDNVKGIQGQMRFFGVDLLSLSAKKRNKYKGSKISMVFQNPNTSLNPVISIGRQMTDVIRQHQPVHRSQAKSIALKWMSEVGLPDPEEVFRSYPHQLSGGMKQRVVIAMALSCNAELIIADEPTTALDVTTQYQILQLIQKLQKEHRVTFLLITHDMGVASYLCDRLAVMYGGRIIEAGPTGLVLKQPVHPYTQGLLKCLPGQGKTVEDLYTIPGVVPSPVDFPEGCRFSTRCEYRNSKCSEQKPPWQTDDEHPGQWYACHYPAGGEEKSIAAPFG